MAISHDPSATAATQDAHSPRRWADRRRQRAVSLAIALVLEALILALLFTLGARIAGDDKGDEVVTAFAASDFTPEAEPEQESPPEQPEESAATPPDPQPVPDQPNPAPEPVRPPPPLISNPTPAPPPPDPQPRPQPSPSPTIAARINPNRTYGPANTGPSRSSMDSERVGTAPNGEPLYAARWYREPTRQELAGYLSTATGPGSALIACRTVEGYYVEDCELLGESPQGSQIGRAVMAAAWQFRVRPARIGGREQFGSWVRIRIDYTQSRTPR